MVLAYIPFFGNNLIGVIPILVNTMKVTQPLLQVVATQIESGNPPETKETFQRLLSEGYTDDQARRLIGYVVAAEAEEVLRQQKPFDHARFVRALRNLPDIDFSCY